MRPYRRRASLAEARERNAATEDPEAVLKAAARFLEARPRSVHEVRRRLLDAGYRAELVDAVVDRLVEFGMLDDEAFARAWVESRDRARPRGQRALRRELRLKGIDAGLMDQILTERAAADGPQADEAADEAAAERLLARRAAALARIGDPGLRRRRAYALLARNGFDPEIAARVAARVAARLAADASE